MRATGIIRRIDDLGRIVIPKEIRRTLRLREGDPMELFVEHDAVMFKPYRAIDNYMAEFETACRLLRWQGVNHYAVFDQRNRVSDYNLETVEYPESHWFDLRHPAFDQTSGLWVYASWPMVKSWDLLSATMRTNISIWQSSIWQMQ